MTFDTTDQGLQAVIPGAERISDRALAERRMQGAKRSTRPQRAADVGLFDQGSHGNDLVDLARGGR